MGTSTACPGSPKWGAVKAASTRAAGQSGIDSQSSARILADFVDSLKDGKDVGIGVLPSDFGGNLQKVKDRLKDLLANHPASPPHNPDPVRSTTTGNSSGYSGTGPSKKGATARTPQSRGRSGSKSSGGKSIRSIGGRGIRPTAQRIATFLSTVSKTSLAEALRESGLLDLNEASPEQIVLALADVLCGPNSLIVDAELRDATASLLEELCPSAQSQEELEKSLTDASYNLEGVISKLFECYIMERFKTTLSEHLSKFGYNTADRIAREARVLVSSEIEVLQSDRVDLTEVDWSGKEGAVIVETILEKTIAVYLS